MLIFLVYDKDGASRNNWFINHLIDLGSKRGIKIKLVLDNVIEDQLKKETPSLILVRTINPELSKNLEERGYKVINNAKTSEICNDKYKSFLFFKASGLECLDTSLLPPKIDNYPVVIKSRKGHGGSEVYKCNNANDYQRFLNEPDKYIYQPLCDEVGIDMRLYMIGNTCVGAMLRTNTNDFRSNFSLGGNAKLINPPKEVIEEAKKITSLLDSDYIGVDFIRHKGQWIINELEDSAGARMLYGNSNIDIASLLLDYLQKYAI